MFHRAGSGSGFLHRAGDRCWRQTVRESALGHTGASLGRLAQGRVQRSEFLAHSNGQSSNSLAGETPIASSARQCRQWQSRQRLPRKVSLGFRGLVLIGERRPPRRVLFQLKEAPTFWVGYRQGLVLSRVQDPMRCFPTGSTPLRTPFLTQGGSHLLGRATARARSLFHLVVLTTRVPGPQELLLAFEFRLLEVTCHATRRLSPFG